jgi:hypothetical protein
LREDRVRRIEIGGTTKTVRRIVGNGEFEEVEVGPFDTYREVGTMGVSELSDGLKLTMDVVDTLRSEGPINDIRSEQERLDQFVGKNQQVLALTTVAILLLGLSLLLQSAWGVIHMWDVSQKVEELNLRTSKLSKSLENDQRKRDRWQERMEMLQSRMEHKLSKGIDHDIPKIGTSRDRTGSLRLRQRPGEQ